MRNRNDIEYITIYAKEISGNLRNVTSNSTFFENNCEYIVAIDEDKIVFTRPSLDYKGKTSKAKSSSGTNVHFTIKAELPIQKFIPIDLEESNEDQLVIYLNQKL